MTYIDRCDLLALGPCGGDFNPLNFGRDWGISADTGSIKLQHTYDIQQSHSSK